MVNRLRCHHHLHRLWRLRGESPSRACADSASPDRPGLAATFRKRRTPCSARPSRHESSSRVGPTCMPASSSEPPLDAGGLSTFKSNRPRRAIPGFRLSGHRVECAPGVALLGALREKPRPTALPLSASPPRPDCAVSFGDRQRPLLPASSPSAYPCRAWEPPSHVPARDAAGLSRASMSRRVAEPTVTSRAEACAVQTVNGLARLLTRDCALSGLLYSIASPAYEARAYSPSPFSSSATRPRKVSSGNSSEREYTLFRTVSASTLPFGPRMPTVATLSAANPLNV